MTYRDSILLEKGDHIDYFYRLCQTTEALKCAYTIVLMGVYWMTEALPLPITSMIPMVGQYIVFTKEFLYKRGALSPDLSIYLTKSFRLAFLCRNVVR